jgi:hypothetical protein
MLHTPTRDRWLAFFVIVALVLIGRLWLDEELSIASWMLVGGFFVYALLAPPTATSAASRPGPS